MEKRRKERKGPDQRKVEMPLCKKHRDPGLLLHLSVGERREHTAMALSWQCCWGLLRRLYMVLRCSKQHCHPPESLAIQGFWRLHRPVPGHSERCATSIRRHCWFTTTSDSNRCIWQSSTWYSYEGPIISQGTTRKNRPISIGSFVELHIFEEHCYHAVPAVTLGIDFLGTWHDKPWCLHDPLPTSMNASCRFQPHVIDRWCAASGSWLRTPPLMQGRLLDEHLSHTVDPVEFEDDGPVDFGHQDPEVFLEEEDDLSFLLASFSQDEDALITLEMYGLLITHHSIRSATTSGDIAGIKDTIWRSWSDIMPQHGHMNAFLLKPQDLIGTGIIQLLIEIVPLKSASRPLMFPSFDVPNGTVMTQQQLKRPTWETRNGLWASHWCRTCGMVLLLSQYFNATCTSKDALPSCRFAIPFDKEQFWASSFMTIGLHRTRMSKRCLLGLSDETSLIGSRGHIKGFSWRTGG